MGDRKNDDNDDDDNRRRKIQENQVEEKEEEEDEKETRELSRYCGCGSRKSQHPVRVERERNDSYVVFEREAREFQSYSYLSVNITVIARSYHKKITRTTTLECRLGYYELNSRFALEHRYRL